MIRRSVKPVGCMLLSFVGIVFIRVSSNYVSISTEITFFLIQLNDIEQIRPRDGNPGNLSRVAALRRRLRLENPNTYLVLPGDLFNPSPMSNVPFAGKEIAGRQMIEVMNAAGLDFVTFGNHLYDLSQQEFLDRLSESDSRWVSTNVVNARTGQSLDGVPPYRPSKSATRRVPGPASP